MDKTEQERRRDEESRRKLSEHLAKIQKLGRLPTEADDLEEERRFETDWQRWKQQYSGRIVEFKVEHVDPDADYKLLGINRKANAKEIRRAFYRLAKTNHPDQGGNAEKFHQLMMAYQRLSASK